MLRSIAVAAMFALVAPTLAVAQQTVPPPPNHGAPAPAPHPAAPPPPPHPAGPPPGLSTAPPRAMGPPPGGPPPGGPPIGQRSFGPHPGGPTPGGPPPGGPAVGERSFGPHPGGPLPGGPPPAGPPIGQRSFGPHPGGPPPGLATDPRFHGPPGRFVYRGREFSGVHVAPFAYPPGWGYRQWDVGAVLPPVFLSPDYYYPEWAALGLDPPPPGFEWVRYGPDLLLVDLNTGEVVDGVYGVFY